jgi:hypothetical protein
MEETHRRNVCFRFELCGHFVTTSCVSPERMSSVTEKKLIYLSKTLGLTVMSFCSVLLYEQCVRINNSEPDPLHIISQTSGLTPMSFCSVLLYFNLLIVYSSTLLLVGRVSRLFLSRNALAG